MQKNMLPQEHLNIINRMIMKRNIEVTEVLKHRDECIVNNRIERLKIQYMSMLDADMFKQPSRVVKVGELECRGYRIEKLVMESLENYFVPMNLYLPDGCKGVKKPAILVNMGHYIEGKALAENQIMCANLALQGFVVLTLDPICQGERDMFPELSEQHCKKDMWVVEQHMKIGNQCYLLGYNSINYFLNDAVKAVDYLVTRQDVDNYRIGVTGQSGGGTLSYLLAALDERIKAAAPIHCISTMVRICKNGIGDSEQSPINMLYKGFDIADFLWLSAPKPLLISAGINDFFSIEGVREIYQELKEVYKILGEEENIKLCEINVKHSISNDVRESVYAFFNEIFLQTNNCKEKEIKIFSEQQLSCDYKSLNGRNPLDYNKTMLELLNAKWSSKNQTIFDIRKSLEGLFLFCDTEYEIFEDFSRSKDGFRKFIIKGSNNLKFEIDVSIKANGLNTFVYIDMEDEDFSDISENASRNVSNTVVIRPFGSCNDSYKLNAAYDDETKLAYQGIISGYSIFELRLNQVLYVLDFLNRQRINENIEIHGKRQGAMLALFASLLNNSVSMVNCEELIFSFRNLFGKKDFIINETDIIPGILEEFDIDILISSLGNKVNVISFADEIKKPFQNRSTIERRYNEICSNR